MISLALIVRTVVDVQHRILVLVMGRNFVQLQTRILLRENERAWLRISLTIIFAYTELFYLKSYECLKQVH